MVKDLFEGVVCLTSRCLVCGETSISFEPFVALQLQKPSSGVTTLSQLLYDFERPNFGCSDSVRFCSTCKCLRACVEHKTIWTLPTILVFHLQTGNEGNKTPGYLTPSAASSRRPSRSASMYKQPQISLSSNSLSSFASAKPEPHPSLQITKINKTPPPSPPMPSLQLRSIVQYPINSLDMSKHLRGSSVSGSPSSIFESGQWNPDDSYDCTYDLFAVREKMNGCALSDPKLGSNMYRTMAKDPRSERWNLFDGPSVSPIHRAESLITPNSDLLFYQRI